MRQMIRWLIVALVACMLDGVCERSSAAVEIKRSLVYKTLEDGSELLTDVYLPASLADSEPDAPETAPDKPRKPYPTILMVHGGAWFSGNKVHVARHAHYAAEHGYAVVAINYRLAPRHKFPAQRDDCRDALAWIQDHADEYGFDTHRLAIYGYSAGAHLACLVGLSCNHQQPDDASVTPGPPATSTDTPLPSPAEPKIRAIVAGGAPCEFSWIPDDAMTLAYWLGDSRASAPEVYQAATPLNFVDERDPPTFLFHGSADRIVPPQSSKKMSEQLKISQVPYQLHIIKDATHIGAFLDPRSREAAILFLNQHVK